MLKNFDFEANWLRVNWLFEEGVCPPALRYRAYKILARARIPRPSMADIEKQENWQHIGASQREDGSFGDHDEMERRILPTLWSLRSLNDLGGGPGFHSWDHAAEFLVQYALVDGAFSIDGRKTGVLSCYTSTFATVLAQGRYAGLGKPDLASRHRTALDELLAWLERFQQVRRQGVQRRRAPLEIYEAKLATRYGGCFAPTSCFTGLVRAAQALVAANHSCDLLDEIRSDLLSRNLYMTSKGAVLPLTNPGTPNPQKDASWLRIQYPIAYHVDLVEVLDAVAASGNYDRRMEPALRHILAQQLPDGSWPLQAKAKQPGLHAPERVNGKRGSAWATFRELEAIRKYSSPNQSADSQRLALQSQFGWGGNHDPK